MASTSIHVQLEEIDGSYPGSSDGTDRELTNYVSFRQRTYLNYSTNDDDIQVSREKMSRAAHYAQQELTADALRTRNDYQSILELATR